MIAWRKIYKNNENDLHPDSKFNVLRKCIRKTEVFSNKSQANNKLEAIGECCLSIYMHKYDKHFLLWKNIISCLYVRKIVLCMRGTKKWPMVVQCTVSFLYSDMFFVCNLHYGECFFIKKSVVSFSNSQWHLLYYYKLLKKIRISIIIEK